MLHSYKCNNLLDLHKDTTFTNSHSKEEIQFVSLTSISLGQYTFLLFQIVIHITLSRILCFAKISLPGEAMQAEQAHSFLGEVYSLYQARKFLLLKDFMPEQAEPHTVRKLLAEIHHK